MTDALALPTQDAVAPADPERPLDSLAQLVAWGAAAFFLAEAGHNEKVQTYWDAVHYISTSLSVGYATIFPETQAGKVIGAVVQMIGPALAAKALEGVGPEQPAQAQPSDPALLEKLDAILAELKAQRRTG